MTSANKYSKIQILLLSLLSSVAIPSNAVAQPEASGRFTLASEARWGTIVLPAGDYIFGVEQTSSLPVVMIYSTSGTGKGMVFPAYVTEMKRDETGKITLEPIRGETVITALYVESLGKVLHYHVGKTPVEMARKKPEPAPAMNSYTQAK